MPASDDKAEVRGYYVEGIVSPSIKIRETPIPIIRVLLKGQNSLRTLQQTNAPSRKLKNHSGKVEFNRETQAQQEGSSGQRQLFPFSRKSVSLLMI
ncbi:hypothetical protein FGO68_gene12014 [Halteria grandinella]|uniref:Uncharacterized protein n=1 Tax=Halteria grandinella TaxID=5974 RepID=A0A8J8NL87_HALGN|nr:hypothetical protein FGO68_gene12014 [Halteria grandinella]